MSLNKRGNTWWIRISHNGQRIQRSTETSDKVAAQRLHDKIKAELWNTNKLQELPEKTWKEAVVRWLGESQHKRSIQTDKIHLRWLNPYLGHLTLSGLTRDLIDNVATAKEMTGVEPSTVNRVLAVIRSILRKAEREWGWLNRAPIIRMRREENARIRWITLDEANRLLEELPSHLSSMVAFTLATGLRQANVTGLKWEDVDLARCHAWVHHDQAKGKKAIAVPLNTDAMTILRKQIGVHEKYVFVYRGNKITQCNTKAWQKALRRANIKNFRWHDLRHTWASWHVQNGTSLQELQQLGGWASYSMALRYAHLSSGHLKEAANRICWYKIGTMDSLSGVEKCINP